MVVWWQLAVQQSLDLKALFDAISVERKYGVSQEMSYHEYVAAAMFHRVTVNDNRLGLMFSYIDVGACSFTQLLDFLN
jgi:hypothetical protein